jgi:hypothetical protein
MTVSKFVSSSVSSGEKTNVLWDKTAIGISSDIELITTTTLGSAQTSVIFSNLNSTASAYRHLRCVVQARAGSNSTAQSITVELNGSTASNYNAHSIYAFKSSASLVTNSWLYVNQNSSNSYCGGADGLTAYPNNWQPNVYEFHDFSQSDKNKYITCLNGCYVSSTDGSVAWNNLMWNQTSPITSIKFVLASAFSAGSRFSLYGIK